MPKKVGWSLVVTLVGGVGGGGESFTNTMKGRVSKMSQKWGGLCLVLLLGVIYEYCEGQGFKNGVVLGSDIGREVAVRGSFTNAMKGRVSTMWSYK